MGKTASDSMIETLQAWGVDTIFGIPGDGINGIMEALRQNKDKVRFIQVRHEEAAAFAACGYSKFSGRLGVCLATSGPGAIHLLNGLYDAKMDGVPVLALTGQQYSDLLGTQYQQEVDLLSLYKDVAAFNQQVQGSNDVSNLVNTACRVALSKRTVAHVTFPIDYQVADADEKYLSHHGGPPKIPGQVSEFVPDLLGQIKWEQIVFLGNPEYGVELQTADFAAWARAAGAEGYHVEDPKQVPSVMREFLSSPRPAVLEAVVDPNEPPLPGKIKPEQAKKFAEALIKGQPEGPRIAITAFRDKLTQMLA